MYALARGGDVGGSSLAGSNAAIAIIAVLGPCGGMASGAAAVIDEATTVASAWALSQFLSADGMLGASATNSAGLANGVLMAQALVSVSTGMAPGVGFGTTVAPPTAKLNTLADLLSGCAARGSGCAALLAAAPPLGGVPAVDTLQAALGIARAPGVNVGSLYGLAGAPAYSPGLMAMPKDWTLAVTYSGGGVSQASGPTAIALDAGGRAWVANYGGVVSAFSPLGEPVFASGVSGAGLSQSYGLAIDASGDVWVTNLVGGQGFGSVTELSGTGAVLSGAGGYTGAGGLQGGVNHPVAVAADSNGTVWVVNTGNATVVQFNSSGQLLSGAKGYGQAVLEFPSAIAIDANHNAWVGNMNATTIARISADGSQATSISCCNGAQGVAIDAGGSVWLADYFGSSVSRVLGDGTVATGSPYASGSLSGPVGIAVDGAGSVWLGNLRGNSVAELAGSSAAAPGALLSPSGGFAADAGLSLPYGLAIDASGDLWVTNTGSGTVTELIGVAAPVRTPLLGPVQQP